MPELPNGLFFFFLKKEKMDQLMNYFLKSFNIIFIKNIENRQQVA